MADQQKKDTRSASQRLTDLERAASQLYNVADNMARDLSAIKEALKMLYNKTNAMVKVSSAGEFLTDEAINREMVAANVAELAAKVKTMIDNKVLVAEFEISENSFVVGNEQQDDGTVTNPRLQFALKSLSPELQAKLLGAKVGDVLDLEPGKFKFKVLESYKIQEPPAPKSEQDVSAPAPAAPSPASAPAADAQASAPAAPAADAAAPEAPAAADASAAQPDQAATPAANS